MSGYTRSERTLGRKGCAWIGTSGWAYPHWRKTIYPSGLPRSHWLEYYAEHLNSVEINSSFYRLPSAHTLASWCAAVTGDFVFACKASRYLTHMKKLHAPETALPGIVDCIAQLKTHSGPLLFQLPPHWQADPGRLAGLLDALPATLRCAFEFRDVSWHCDTIYDLLRSHGAAMCIYDLNGQVSPREITANFIYIRLHGPTAAYRGSYDDKALQAWAATIEAWRNRGNDVYAYFNNDEAGYAFANAKRLGAMLQTGRTGPS